MSGELWAAVILPLVLSLSKHERRPLQRTAQRAAVLLLALLAGLVHSVAVVGDAVESSARVRYEVRASISLDAPQVRGTVEARFVNSTDRDLEEAVFLLFPNRFAVPDRDVDDFSRPYVYPDEEFHPGWMEIIEARVGDHPVTVEPLYRPNLADGSVIRVPIPPLPPGGVQCVTLRFQTVAPLRFGSFGLFDDQLTLVGGWHPYLAALSADGTWLSNVPPPLADFDVQLVWSGHLTVLLNGRDLGSAHAGQAVLRAHYLSLLAAPEWLREEASAEGTRIVYYRRPPRRVHRISPEPRSSEIVLDALHDMVTQRPRPVPDPPAEVVAVEAPLRLDLAADGEGAVIVSDRAMKVHRLIRPFHEGQLAQAVYAELLRPDLSEREGTEDYFWVSEGLAHLLAHRFVARRYPETRSVQDWIDLFNIFAIVDRFESAPQIPFVDAFFDRSPTVDPLRQEIATFNQNRPPGRMVIGKVREQVGPSEFDLVLDTCLQSPMPLRLCAQGAMPGVPLDDLLREWLRPYPAINYAVESVRLNEPEAGRYRHSVAARRESARPYTEPVTVRLRTVGGRDVDLHWKSPGQLARLWAQTDERAVQVLVDPDRKLIDDDRRDNASPRLRQIMLDSADVEVSSTEFGLSGLVVARDRYDYDKDLALAGFFTNRSVGFTAGARGHWGKRIDATRHRQNLYLFYGFQVLNGHFDDDSRPEVHTDGHLASLGVRYGYANNYSLDHPTDERSVVLFGDWYDGILGSDYEYAEWGASVVLTEALWTARTVGALQVMNGFSEPISGSRVPNQGLFSLGGSLSIRGIGAEEELARNIFVVRSELRQAIYPEVDLNLLDLLVMRRGQVKLFVDTGRVNDSAGRIYDPAHYAVGVGVGFGAFYEFMGFFPSLVYLELATRVDKSSAVDEVQVLFGTRRSF